MEPQLNKIIRNHRSIRKFTDKQIDDKMLNEILDAARHASSHHNIQAYSIIKIRDKETKKTISQIAAGQKWIEECPVFIVVCMDFHRISEACNINGEIMQIDEIESIVIGSIDSALVGQNIMLMAEEAGLGGVIIGGIRNDPSRVIQVLNLPKYTFPLFGICLGYPDINQIPWLKPRIPNEISIYNECYENGKVNEGLKKYEEITIDYYTRRTMGRDKDGWSKRTSDYISKERRPYLKDELIKQGFPCK